MPQKERRNGPEDRRSYLMIARTQLVRDKYREATISQGHTQYRKTSKRLGGRTTRAGGDLGGKMFWKGKVDEYVNTRGVERCVENSGGG